MPAAQAPQNPPPGADLALDWLRLGHDLVATTDADGAVQWANAQFCDATGLAPSALVTDSAPGAHLNALLPAEPAAQATRAAVDRALRGEALHDVQLEWQTTAGAPLWVRARTLASAGQIVWILNDITQAVLAERSAERQTELLGMAQEFGRLGIWERNIQSGQGRWDRHLFGFWGMDPGLATPDWPTAAAQVHPDDHSFLTLYQESTRRAGHYARRYRVIRPDGSIRWLHAQWTVKNGASGQPERAIGAVMDDTEAFELARSLGDATEQLKLAVELGNLAIWRHDLQTNLMHYNDRAFAVLDIPPRPQGLPIAEVRSLIHPDDLPRVVASAEQSLLSSKPIDVEARYRRSDGAWRDIMTRRVVQRGASGEPVAFLGMALDVTELREARAALRSADQRAALATRSAGIGTWEVDLVQGVERWDEQMFALRGLPPRDKPPTREERLALLHPADAHLVLDSQRNALSADESSQYEFRVMLPGGSYRWLASRSMPVRDEQGTTVQRVGVNWDITESRNAQVARQEKAVAERESQAKSQFLSRMSHELRTPLNAVLGFTQLLQRDAGATLDPEQLNKLGHIRSAGEHLLSLINDVLDLSSLEAGNLRLDVQAVDLGAIVAQALPLVESLAAQRQVRLRFSHTRTSDAVLAWADPTRVLQVLLNLLSNAIKYNRAQGEVTITLRSAGPAALLAVKDGGRGMTPEQVSHLFEPFNRLGIEGEGIAGTGIGLVIVKALVEGMGGTLAVASQAGHGTTFELNLPRASARPAAAAAPAETGETAAALQTGPQAVRRGQLLYIEDNPVNALLVQELVGTVAGLTLACESTGEAGVERALSLRPDLILVDMQLPDFDGIEVLRRLRGQPVTASIPCIALSANAMPEDIARALGAGFEDYWTKPIDFKAFITGLERLFPLRAGPSS